MSSDHGDVGSDGGRIGENNSDLVCVWGSLVGSIFLFMPLEGMKIKMKEK